MPEFENEPRQTFAPAWILAMAAAAALLLGATVLLLVPLRFDYRARWYSAAQDACHVPLFGLLTFLWVKYGWPQRQKIVIGFTAVMAGVAELVQPWFGRSASWSDFALGGIGIAIAAVWLGNPRRPWRRTAWTALLVAWPLWVTGPVLVDAGWSWLNFPVLARDQSPLGKQRWWLEGVQMTHDASQLTFGPNPQGSSAVLFPVVRDWTGYRWLDVDFAFEGEPLLFLISVRDGKRLPPELPRFDLWRRYSAGRHHVRIDLDELQRGGRFPPIDLQHVQSLHLVAYGEQSRIVVLERIELAGLRKLGDLVPSEAPSEQVPEKPAVP
jgi:hypothetical protein